MVDIEVEQHTPFLVNLFHFALVWYGIFRGPIHFTNKFIPSNVLKLKIRMIKPFIKMFKLRFHLSPIKYSNDSSKYRVYMCVYLHTHIFVSQIRIYIYVNIQYIIYIYIYIYIMIIFYIILSYVLLLSSKRMLFLCFQKKTCLCSITKVDNLYAR